MISIEADCAIGQFCIVFSTGIVNQCTDIKIGIVSIGFVFAQVINVEWTASNISTEICTKEQRFVSEIMVLHTDIYLVVITIDAWQIVGEVEAIETARTTNLKITYLTTIDIGLGIEEIEM